jgi:hypothetical protein
MMVKTLMIGVLIFTLVVSGAFYFVSALAPSYGKTVPSELNPAMSFTSAIENQTTKLNSDIQDAKLTNTPLDLFVQVPVAIYGVAKISFEAVSQIGSEFVHMVIGIIPIPPWAAQIIGVLMIIGLIYAIVRFFTWREW